MPIKMQEALLTTLIQSWRTGISKTWILTLAQSFTSCVNLDKLMNLSELLLIYKVEQTILPISQGVRWGLNGTAYKCPVSGMK